MFFLPDGSSGWLNGGSYLEFPTEFKGKSREVVLRGEAYFDVISNAKKPFVVSGTNIEVVAYGTSFNIRAYQEDQIINVTLVSGSVEEVREETRKLISILGKNGGYLCGPSHFIQAGIPADNIAAFFDEANKFYPFS